MSDTLEDRVKQFRSLALPGQPMMMHMGTSYLVEDLWREIATLTTELARLRERCERMEAVVEAAREIDKGWDGEAVHLTIYYWRLIGLRHTLAALEQKP